MSIRPNPTDERSLRTPAGIGAGTSRPRGLAPSDSIVVAVAFLGSSVAVSGLRVPGLIELVAMFALFGGWMLALAAGRTRDERILGSGSAEYSRVLVSSLAFAGTAALALSLMGVDFSTGGFSLAIASGILMLLASRAVWRARLASQLRNGIGLLPVLVAGENADSIASRLSTSTTSGLEPVELALGRIEPNELVERAVAARVGAVVLSGVRDAEETQHLIWKLEDRGIEVIVSTDLLDVTPDRLAYRDADGIPLLHLRSRRMRSRTRVVKTIIDRTAAGFGLLILAPVFAVVALIVRSTDRGPVFFRQTRVGMDGQRFQMVKFRTMVVDAEARLEALRAQNEGSGPLFKLKHDPRITPAGRVLRKFSIDELPQLWNVFIGDMSLVGPRPALPSEVLEYPDHATRRLLVRPGITGLWQVSGRSDLSWEAGLRLDLSYVDNWALHRDFHILGRTVGTVLRPNGAY